MDATAAALQRYQMEGQDVPWLLALRAEHRAEHPALIWDPPTGDVRTWTYRELWDDVRRLAAGLHVRGVEVGDKVLLHAGQLARTAPGLAGVCHRRGSRGHHEHQVSGRGGGLVRREGAVRGRDHPTPLRRGRCRGRFGRQVGGSDGAGGGRGVGRLGRSAVHLLRRSFGEVDDVAGTGDPDPLLPYVHHVHLRHDLEAQGRGPHACQRHLGQPDRGPQHRPRPRRPLPRLHPVLPRERPNLVGPAGLRHGCHRRPGAQVVLQSLLGVGAAPPDHPFLAHAVHAWRP